jgi:hypothetical protein
LGASGRGGQLKVRQGKRFFFEKKKQKTFTHPRGCITSLQPRETGEAINSFPIGNITQSPRTTACGAREDTRPKPKAIAPAASMDKVFLLLFFQKKKRFKPRKSSQDSSGSADRAPA